METISAATRRVAKIIKMRKAEKRTATTPKINMMGRIDTPIHMMVRYYSGRRRVIRSRRRRKTTKNEMV